MNKISALIASGATFAASSLMGLSVGSFAFTAVGVDDEDFQIVALEDISAGETVFFTDDEWGGSSFNTGEGFVSWITPTISAGTVITLTDTSTTVGGTVTSQAGTFALSNSGDGIFLYQTSNNVYNGSVSTIIGFAGEDSGDAGTLSGTGLTIGSSAIYFGGDNGMYTGSRSGESSFADYLPLIYNSTWSTSGSAQTYSTTDFSIVPEPTTYAAIAGVLMLGLAAYRRRRA